jgi:hypothetical protein
MSPATETEADAISIDHRGGQLSEGLADGLLGACAGLLELFEALLGAGPEHPPPPPARDVPGADHEGKRDAANCDSRKTRIETSRPS